MCSRIYPDDLNVAFTWKSTIIICLDFFRLPLSDSCPAAPSGGEGVHNRKYSWEMLAFSHSDCINVT